MAKTPEAQANIQPALVHIILQCIYSGDGTSANPGDVIAVDAVEADRLIGLGVAQIAPETAPTADPE